MKNLILFLLILLSASNSWAQKEKLHSKNKKALAFFEDALVAYNRRLDADACELFKKALVEDDKFLEARVTLADILTDLGRFEEAEANWEKLLLQDKDFFPKAYLRLSISQMGSVKFDKAIPNLETFLKQTKLLPDIRIKAERMLESAKFGAEAVKHPVPYNPINLGANVNTADFEYFPSLTTDGKTLIFTRNRRDERGHHQEDFYVSNRSADGWSAALNLGPPINTDGNEGAQCISPDGQWIFMTACNRKDGEGSCDIYISRKTANGWSEPRNPKTPLNSDKWESQPGFSVDGKTLYFSSNRPGGKGGMDIWYSTFITGKGWGEPKNLVIINTAGNEQSPFIHPDDQTLYFSSDGLPGLGKQDLFYCRRQPDGYWGVPQNMGYPINTPGDEQGLMVSAQGDTAFISTDKKGGFGELDLYSFALYPEARPQTVTYFKGKITDKETGAPLEANFELIDLATGEVKARSNSTAGTGEFLVSLPMNRNYALNVSKDKYLFYSESFELTGSNTAAKPVFKNVQMSPIRAGEKIVLRNIFFDSNKFDLKPESNSELEKLVEILSKNPTMKVEISGHTDNVGNKVANKTLSENRSKSVVAFLISKGISSDRLSSKGYGDEKPIDTNDTEQGRANNRRTEMVIL